MKSLRFGIYIISIFVVIIFASKADFAQACPTSRIFLVALDEKGAIINASTLESITEVNKPEFRIRKFEKIQNFDAATNSKTLEVLALEGSEVRGCTATLGELIITHRKKTMRLIFNIAFVWSSENEWRKQVKYRILKNTFGDIKFPPLQNGTFEYVYPDYTIGIVNMTGWKKINDKAMIEKTATEL